MFGKRYVAIAVSIFAIGVVFGVKVFNIDTFSLRAIFIAIAILSVCAFVFFAVSKKVLCPKKILAATFAVAAFSLGVIRVGLFNDAASDSSLYNGKNDTVKFELTEIKENSLEVKVVSSEIGLPEGENVRFYSNFDFGDNVAGDIVVANVSYRYQNKDNFYSNGIALSANGDVLEVENGNGIFCKIRRFISESAENLYSDFDYAEPISKAVTVGDKSNLDSFIYSVYNSSGISHVLAISGLHVTLIAFYFQKLLIFLKVNRRIACSISAILIVLYAAFVGFTPSITRASIMVIAVMVSKIYMRRADSITTLFMALGVLLMLNPYSLFSVSLELSFVSSFAILAFEPILTRIDEFFDIKKDLTENKFVKLLYSFANSLITPALMSFSTTIFSFFVILLTFDSVSYVAPLVNIVVVPIFSYGLMFAIAAFLISIISMPIAIIVAKPAGYIFDFITDLGEFVHKSDIGRISTYVDLILIPCIISVVMISSLLFMHRYKIKVFTVSSVLFCFSIAFCGMLNSYSNKGVTLIEYGQVGGEYVFFRNDETSLYFDVGGYTAEPAVIFENGFTSLDSYVMTDYDSYSFKRFDFFNGRTSVSKVYIPKPKNISENGIYNQIKLLANKRNYDIIEFDGELVINTNDLSVTLIADEFLSEGAYIAFDGAKESVNIFIDGYVPVNQYDIAVFNRYDDKYLFDAQFDNLYFPKESVNDTVNAGYVNTFVNKLRIVYDVESDRMIYEP